MKVPVSTQSWRRMLTFGILFCVVGATEIVAGVLSLKSHTGSRQVLDWVLLAASVVFFLAALATIVLALVRRRASNRTAGADDE
jgi:hypothetical protein